MTAVLQINNSVFGDDGQSSQLADQFVAQLRERTPSASVTRRDLAAAPLRHLPAERFSAALTDPQRRTAEQAQEAAIADTVIEELEAADVLVIAAPVYNFNVASTLKAWFDHVARAGRTFRYTADGPEGLLRDKTAYIFVTSGGQYAGTELDFQVPYIRHFLAFLGITDVHFIRAEGLAMGEETSREALEAAGRRIDRLVA
ncbi:NAD(P)H-dependent oxidoreductase [Aquisalimonas sp.]|uniref:FMN-dependent NADH-azoreductase n=1 Tax=Aquisalimonas sp. TaxID=1872621 RepID=UPI0025BC6351|nr:NAD(P)H-dependent oxidoreductase [Aquisalimonas sp.]